MSFCIIVSCIFDRYCSAADTSEVYLPTPETMLRLEEAVLVKYKEMEAQEESRRSESRRRRRRKWKKKMKDRALALAHAKEQQEVVVRHRMTKSSGRKLPWSKVRDISAKEMKRRVIPKITSRTQEVEKAASREERADHNGGKTTSNASRKVSFAITSKSQGADKKVASKLEESSMSTHVRVSKTVPALLKTPARTAIAKENFQRATSKSLEVEKLASKEEESSTSSHDFKVEKSLSDASKLLEDISRTFKLDSEIKSRTVRHDDDHDENEIELRPKRSPKKTLKALEQEESEREFRQRKKENEVYRY